MTTLLTPVIPSTNRITTNGGSRYESDSSVIWRGKLVPKVLEVWMDQLMREAQMLEYYSQTRYIDVTMTIGSAVKVAKPPQILIH